MIDKSKIFAFDTETYRFSPGNLAPKIVCASISEIVNGKPKGKLLVVTDNIIQRFGQLIEADSLIAFANAPYDLAVIAQASQELLPLIFRAIEKGQIHDILTARALNDIYGGHLFLNPNMTELRNPSTGKITHRYSLALVTQLVLGRTDAKKNDAWRESYALLDNIPPERWSEEARVYPVDDTDNTLEVAIAQIEGIGKHDWIVVPASSTICRHCGETYSFDIDGLACLKAPKEPHKNLNNLPAQVEADFAAHLGACHGLRTDPKSVEKLSALVEEKHAIAVKRFKAKGWIREDGTEDQCAVKRAVAIAYGATGNCSKCGGSGKVQKSKLEDCRGIKEKNRFKGCLGVDCEVCFGSLKVEKIQKKPVTCKNIFDKNTGDMIEGGCDGTGLDLSTAPMLPRTEKQGVKTDRDASMESGDEDISDYGENEFEKSLSTYVPYLRSGIDKPLSYSPNVLVATGRYSYEGSPMHQMPRDGLERECIRARGAWCGYPEEMILGATDYQAGELCTLAQYCYWVFGYSQMREIINHTGEPGILHSDLAAEVLGLSLPEFLSRLKAKDKQAKDFRYASKSINFGRPGGMGTPKLIITNRKKNAGFTLCENGPATNKKGETGYWGIRYCILVGGAKQCGTEKILTWKDRACAPVCATCAEVVENILTPAYFRRYPEVKDLHRWVADKIDRGEPSPCAVWDPEVGAPKIVRLRGGCDFPSFANNVFQSMLSDVIKHAYVAMRS